MPSCSGIACPSLMLLLLGLATATVSYEDIRPGTKILAQGRPTSKSEDHNMHEEILKVCAFFPSKYT
eukprot:2052941-Amphidinium_carterae.1